MKMTTFLIFLINSLFTNETRYQIVLSHNPSNIVNVNFEFDINIITTYTTTISEFGVGFTPILS